MQKIDFQDLDLSSSCFSDLSSFFEASALEQLGREVKFIERSSSRLSAWMFLQLNTCLIQSGKETSLTDLADELSDRFGIQLSKQSLAERFNCYGVKLMRKCFEAVFEKVLGASTSEQKPDGVFGRVILRDATSFQLPAYLSSFYQGNAGDSTGSVLKIQTEYDLLSAKIVRLDLRNGKENDSEWLNQKGLECVANDLHLMDLGYYKHGHLAGIAGQKAYFISRYKVGTSLFTKDTAGKYQALDWEQVFAEFNADDFEKQVWMGEGKEKLFVRLHLQKIPEEILAKRLKKYQLKDANQPRSRKPYQTSEFKKKLAAYNIFITNTTKEQLKTSQIYTFYKLRWQIELLFKIWKSLFEIDEIGKMSIGRFECYLYGKLIAILISGHIQSLFNTFIEDKSDFELSQWKAYKLLKKS